jgi:predicted transcriptional regulator
MMLWRPLPSGAVRLPPAEEDVLAAVLQGGRLTVRVLADRAGRSVSTVHAALVKLRDAGVVAWEDGRAGTLRSLVVEVGGP